MISLEIGDFHLKSPKITILVKILHFHGFWVKKRTSAAPGQNALKTNRKSMIPGVKSAKIAKMGGYSGFHPGIQCIPIGF